MKNYAGHPVEVIWATINGEDVEVGVVFRWNCGMRRTRWSDGFDQADSANLKYVPYDDAG
ncbi:hypothetical protein PVW51_16755 [Sulfitobacter sp. PR48]|uniref:hypothetical protein n=1 Tax=Roseobacteraceae TaxID=2854170 RepID=UPI000DF33A7B|nr:MULTISPECIES: hypothetical protein [Roseobacteraceae]MDD9722356.1 hypothetical protein [Sulfitobacter sp. PR48]UOA29521.1 hypothetical protein DSM107133_04283 [Pseudosulfitobacter sp. DSM 107133]